IAGAGYLIASFVLNRRWAFRAHRGRAVMQLARHGLVSGGGIVLCVPLLWVLVPGLRLPYQIAWAAAGGTAFCSCTFPMHRWFTSRAGPRVAPPRRSAETSS